MDSNDNTFLNNEFKKIRNCVHNLPQKFYPAQHGIRKACGSLGMMVKDSVDMRGLLFL